MQPPPSSPIVTSCRSAWMRRMVNLDSSGIPALSVWTWSLLIYINRWAMKESLVVTQPVYFKGWIYWNPVVGRVTASVDECCHVHQHVGHFNWRSACHIKDGHVWKWQKVGRLPCLHFVPQSEMLILWTVTVLGAADAFGFTCFWRLSGLSVST